MASSGPGFGRGGRGAALLQALNQPPRKPGDEGKVPPPSSSGAAPSTLKTVPTVPMGRGAFLSGLLEKQREASQSGAQPVIPGGRGVTNLQALMQSAGRGGGVSGPAPAQHLPQVSQSLPAALPQTVTSSTQQSPTSSQGEPPTSRFSRMTLDRPEVVHKSGSDGQMTKLGANYIRLKCLNPGVYQYHVSYSPNIDSKNMRFKMMSEHVNVIGNTKAFDGSILFLPIRLRDQETILHSKRLTDGVDVTIIVRLTKVVEPQQCVPLYNIIFRRIMHILEMVQVGRYYYNPKTPSAVPQHKLEVWPGYITSVCENEGGLMLLADASHRVLRTETVLQMMQSIVQRNPQGFQDECTKALVGAVILTRYNNKTYRIDDIVWDKTPEHGFTTTNGSNLTFVDYYKKSYNLEIKDLQQPLLLHRPKKKDLPKGKQGRSEDGKERAEAICLIPELCNLTGLTDDLRKDFRVMKDLAFHTRVTPSQRVVTMKKFIRSVNGNPDAKAELTKWGLELEEETLNMDGRIVPEEKILFRGGQSCMSGNSADWGGTATRSKVITAVDLNNWVVLYFKRDQPRAQGFIETMMKCCPQMGIMCESPSQCELKDDRTETFIRAIREQVNPTVQIVVIICPTSRDDRYSAIKKLCCVECPVPSQVIISKTIGDQKKLRSVSQKIALQMNCKLGGELWAVEIPMRNLMVIGIDVYHDAARNKRSIAGFVASTNKNCTRWYSRTCFQLPGQELVDGLKICLTSAIRKYYEINHVLPEKIVVFRDGVGDGDLKYIEHEVSQFSNCFGHFGQDYQPRMAVVIVQKRINTRIFSQGNRDYENPRPGTIVDHTVTRRDKYDFFLVSQHVRQGTVSPTHYICVHDTTNMKADHLQRLSFKMTHLYYNWPGTVRVPAPCQYAHKLAYLVGQNIHKEPSSQLADRLFFL